MMETRIACPTCGKRLKTTDTVTIGDRFRCPFCDRSFNVEARDVTMPPGVLGPVAPPRASQRTPVPVAVPFAPPPTLPDFPPTPFEGTPAPAYPPPATAVCVPPPRPMRGRSFVLLGAAGVLVLAVAAGLAIGLSGGPGKKPDPSPTPVADGKKPVDKQKERDDSPLPGVDPPRQEEKKPDPPRQEDKPDQPSRQEEKKPDPRGPRIVDPPEQRDKPQPPVPAPAGPRVALPPERQEEVNKAIDSGVAFLRRTQLPTGSWLAHAQHSVGMAALPALTLLECGVPATDPAVQRALAYVRREGPREMMTYDIALAILFLDRLADPRDRRLIQTLGLRLVAGQQTTGGWTYHCRDLFTPSEELVFFDILQQTRPKDPLKLFDGDKKDERMAFFLGMKERQDLTTGRLEAPTTRSMDAPWTGPLFGQQAKVTVGRIESTSPNAATIPLEQIKSPKTPLDRVPPKFRDIPVLRPLPSARDLPAGDTTDNSNTQFGILGIWAAARHNIPMERTLAMLVKRFRSSQNGDGSWGYHYRNGGGSNGSPAMICAGLLGLAVGHGLVAGSDPKLAPQTAKDPAIQQALKTLSTHLDETPPPPRMPRKAPRIPPRGPKASAANCYFLWSVERVGVLYDLPKIGESDWYSWGVDVLLPRQAADGSWPGGVGNSDTCLALLFLKRANLTRDLTGRLNFLQPKEKPEK